MIKVALPKGRIGTQALEIFESLTQEKLEFEDRKLILQTKNFTFMLIRNQDIPIYIERQVADIGIVGLDVLEEQQRHIIRLLDLEFGKCKIIIGSPKDSKLDFSKPNLKIATKMENIAKSYFAKKALSVDIIKLYGSIELAPLVNLADGIVDIVETGSTIEQNNLKIDEVIMEVSAYLVANENSFYTKKDEILKIQEFFKPN
ncbi:MULTISPECIES: ATP phosphoribosyltransferase [Helicobacter]|uniref:ATP phosphoribosyltransferase n=1 Tax=Helicobacter ibis TaxID=2962633 RepID=A0ABT4VC33_9HELI|nr:MULTISPECIES: ATP phosphoribosyltransferase [Helicobacter]MDA3967524.1 ATP phosphoribosyltransferase [Helicobacter sp. WB40]MDA3968272.1 ATP phosphoribosyltransferase [Helicobacter ibis]